MSIEMLKIAMSGFSLLRPLLTPGEKEKLEARVINAIEQAKGPFYEKYRNMFGNEKNSFLVRRENEDAILNSILFGDKFIEPSDINPRGFDDVPEASIEAISDFLDFLLEEVKKDIELVKHLSYKSMLQVLPITKNIEGEQKKQSTTLESIKSSVTVLTSGITAIPSQITDYAAPLIDKEHQQQIDYSRELLQKKKFNDALGYLEWLRNNIWSTTSAKGKFRIITNIGAAYMSLGENPKAAEHLIQALQYNPDDELANCNAAQAFFILTDEDNARLHAEKALKLNITNATAYAVLVQLGPGLQSLDEFVQQTPSYFLTSPEVCFAISILYRKVDDLEKAQAWLEKALDNDTKSWSDLRAALGGIYVQRAMDMAQQWGYEAEASPTNIKDQALKGVGLITEAWDQIVNTDVVQNHSDWIYNRSVGFFLSGDLSEAINDIEQALTIRKDNIVYLKVQARYYMLSGNFPKALQIIGKIEGSLEFPEAPVLKSEILRKVDIISAEKEILRFIKSDTFNTAELELQRIARRILIRIYLDQKKWPDARKFHEEICHLDQGYVLHTVDWSTLDRLESRETGSIEALSLLALNLPDDLSPQNVKIVAEELYIRKCYELAANLYKRLLIIPGDGYLTERLILSYYYAGMRKQALELSLQCIDVDRSSRLTTEIACSILLDIGDISKARQIYSSYLEVLPNDYEIAIRRALIDLRVCNVKNLRAFVSESIPIDELDQYYGAALAQIFIYLGQTQKAISLLYEIRRKFYAEPEVHGAYISYLMGTVIGKESWVNPKTVSKDTAVCITSDSNDESWYIIEDRSDSDVSKREIPLSHHLTLKLLNKKNGSKILLSENRISPQYGYIKSITSKYIYALQESQTAIGKTFKSVPGIESIHISSSQERSPSTVAIEIKKLVIDRADFINNIEKEYAAGRLSLGGVAKYAGVSLIDVWSSFIQNKSIGIKCFSGSHQDYENASIALGAAKTLVIDLSSILTIREIELEKMIQKSGKRLVIAQSTVDEIYEALEQAKSFQRRSPMFIRKEGVNLVRHEYKAHEIKIKIAFLKRIVNWCQKHCVIVPCYEALEQNRSTKVELDNILGESFADSLLIAKQENGVLLTDDNNMRLLAHEKEIASVWCHAMVNWYLENRIIKAKEYNKITVCLIQKQYKYIGVNWEIVIESAKQANWEVASPFIEVVEVLNNKCSDHKSAINVAHQTIMEIWLQPIELGKKVALIDLIIQALFACMPNTMVLVAISFFEHILSFRPNLRDILREIIKLENSSSANIKKNSSSHVELIG